MTVRHTIFALLAALLVVGCGGSDSSTTATTPGTDAPAAPATSTGGAGGGSALGAVEGAVARVGGQEISAAELDEIAAARLVRLQVQAYELRKQALDEMIDERLLTAEAETRGITMDELIKVEVTDKLTEPTDEEAKAYFDANPPRGNVDFERIKPRVKAFMQRQQEQDLRGALVATLREKASVEVLLEPLRFDVDGGEGNPSYGDVENAPVLIVEFSEFQCPYCSRVLPTIDQVKEEYGDKVAIVCRDFPLPMHKDAPKAAEAAHCAQEQDKFWEMHDLMFANQRALGVDKLKGYATELGLDEAAFATCLDSGKYADAVEADKEAGARVGVSGTPAFFINGQFLNGARPFESFKEVIDAELQAKGLL